MIKFLVTIVTVSLMSLAFAGDVNKIAESCAGCHGKDGASTEAGIPTIGGMSAKFLESTFKAYKGKERPCAEVAIVAGADKGKKSDMCKAVEGLSDEDVKALSKLYAGKKFVRANQKFDAALAEKGKEAHKAKCEKCHSEGGSVAADEAGILAGQQIGYMTATLKEYMSEKRPMEKKMKAKFEGMDEETINALANYYASFK